MNLISLDTKPLHHMQNQSIIIAFDIIAGIFFRSEIAANTELIRIGKHDARRHVRHSLRDSYMSMQSVLPFTVKMDKASHRIQNPSRNGKT